MKLSKVRRVAYRCAICFYSEIHPHHNNQKHLAVYNKLNEKYGYETINRIVDKLVKKYKPLLISHS